MTNRIRSDDYSVKHPSTQDFQFIAGNLALDFINTVGNRLGAARDYLTGVNELNRWTRLAALLPKGSALRLPSREMGTVRRTREELYRLFQPLALGLPISPGALARINRRFGSIAHKRQLRLSKDGISWFWDTPFDDPDYILGPLLLSATSLLANRPSARIRQCQGDTCGWLFLDRSPSGHRRWCSMSDCGNRAKASRHYWRNR
jgi:predicted RNA-binding Zn ribbon-like protein